MFAGGYIVVVQKMIGWALMKIVRNPIEGFATFIG